MVRASLVLALCVVLSFVAGAALEREASPAQAHGAQGVQRLVPETVAGEISVAAVKVKDVARGEEFLFVRSKGVWRCATTFGAVCDAELLSELLADFTQARGVLRSESVSATERYGLDDTTRLEVSFHGPAVLDAEDEDTLLAFEVGHSLPGTHHGRSFVRARGTASVLEIDRNPRKLLERSPESTLPPLLDRRLLAGPWEGRPRGFARIEVQRPGSVLTVVHEDLPPGEVDPSGATWTWKVREGARSGDASPHRGLGFTAFALHVRYSGFANPGDAAELGLERAVARVTLTPTQGEVMHLRVGPPTPSGFSYVLHEENRMLLQVDAETARLLAPTADMLLDETIPNPWELWLSLLSGVR
jgi:hypothetical protein